MGFTPFLLTRKYTKDILGIQALLRRQLLFYLFIISYPILTGFTIVLADSC